VKTLDVDTPTGPARVHLRPADQPRGGVALGHGAGGGVEAVDLVAATDGALDSGFSVALIEQPYRVAGKRAPAAAKRLDEAWIAVLEHLRSEQLAGLPLVVGGRSLGARVACRTIGETGGVAALCLAFPLLPPRRGERQPQSRLSELDAVKLPVLIVQGKSDRFGMPPAGRNRKVVQVRGDHSLKSDTDAVTGAVGDWLSGLRLGG